MWLNLLDFDKKKKRKTEKNIRETNTMFSKPIAGEVKKTLASLFTPRNRASHREPNGVAIYNGCLIVLSTSPLLMNAWKYGLNTICVALEISNEREYREYTGIQMRRDT